MAYDEKLADHIRQELRGKPGIDEKEMFGGICFLSDEKMFVGVVKDELMARVGADNAERLVQRKDVRRMDFTGRPMAGYLFVGPGAMAGEKLREYVELALDFVATVKKRPKRKKAAPTRLKPRPSAARGSRSAASGSAQAGTKKKKKAKAKSKR